MESSPQHEHSKAVVTCDIVRTLGRERENRWGIAGTYFLDQVVVHMDICKENCSRCFQVCLLTFNYCVAQGSAHAEPNHLMILRDCINICRTAEEFLINGSRYHPLTCGVCARICSDCATSCLMFEGDDVLAECAAVCTRCSDSCTAMAHQGL